MLGEDDTPWVYKTCTGCGKKFAVKEDEVTCPECGTVTLQEGD